MPRDSLIGEHIEELELAEPSTSCWIACCLSTDLNGSGRPPADEDWKRALSLIPIKDRDTEKLFKVRLTPLR